MKTIISTQIIRKNPIHLAFFLFILFSLLVSTSFAQTTGDFRSKITGNWESSSSWETYNGSIWENASNYPGQLAGNYTVTILFGHTITISENGITTAQMGDLNISGFLNLTGGQTSIVNYRLQTQKITVTPNLTPYATINFMNKADLLLGEGAIIIVRLGGLTGDCNNNQDIFIGTQKFAVCHGAPGSLITFEELMAAGGTINANITAPSESCLENGAILLAGAYTGAIVSAPTYSWSGTKPGGSGVTFSPNSTTNNVSFTPDVVGTYSISLTCTTNDYGTLYYNTETQTISVSADAIAVASGDWTNPSIWSIGVVPLSCSNVTISNGVVVNLNSIATINNVANNGTLNINNNGTLNSLGTFTNNSTGTLNISGSIIAAVINYTAIGNTVNYQSTLSNQAVYITNYHNLGILNDQRIATISNNINVNGNLTITGNLQSSNQNLNVSGNFINNGAFIHNNGRVIFNGISSQIISGSSQTTFGDFTISNSNTGIILNTAIEISGVLTCNDGIIDATLASVTLLANASSINAANESHVKGIAKKVTNSSALFTFPIGDGTYYRPVSIINASNNTWSAQYFNTGFGNEFTVCQTDIPKLHHVSTKEYWDIQPVTPGGSIQLTLTWNNNSDVLYPQYLLIGHWNSTNLYWQSEGPVTIDEGLNTLTSNNSITSFSPFTLGSSSDDGALPIELITIDAHCNANNFVTIHWTTASETNNEFYSVLRSSNGVDWKEIGKISGGGTTNSINTYNFTDNTPAPLYAYYKLMQIDYNGFNQEFDIMCVFCQNKYKEISISPIPARDFVNFTFYNEQQKLEDVTISIYNEYGKIIYTQIFQATPNENLHKINLPQTLPDGTYFLQAKLGKTIIYSASFLKKYATTKKTSVITDIRKLGF